MKYGHAPDGHAIRVGDIVVAYNCGSRTWALPVSRTTEKSVFVKFNEVAEGKGKRTYARFGWRLGPYDRAMTYKVFTPIIEEIPQAAS